MRMDPFSSWESSPFPLSQDAKLIFQMQFDPLLSISSTTTLVQVFFTSFQDYSNTLLTGFPNSSLIPQLRSSHGQGVIQPKTPTLQHLSATQVPLLCQDH